MHAAYSNFTQEAQVLALLNNLVPDISKLWLMPSPAQAMASLIQLARTKTARRKVLILSDPAQSCLAQGDDLAFIAAGNAGQLCAAIANSNERLAALVVRYAHASTFYYKKVRELSSAEGAAMIWDALDIPLQQAETNITWAKNSQPDLMCFQFDSAIWLGAKQDMPGEI
jgi:glutamate-1-semialdehyde aminotransferase